MATGGIVSNQTQQKVGEPSTVQVSKRTTYRWKQKPINLSPWLGTHALISCTARGAWIQSTCNRLCPWFWGYLSPKPPASFNLHTAQRNFAFFKKIVNTFSFWIMCHWLCFVSSFTRECPLFSALLPFNLQLP